VPKCTDEGLRRDVGFFGLLWFSAGTTLGSGWLFGAFVAVTIAGPSALVGWVLVALFMAPLALIYAELGAMFPESGGPGRFADHAFGSLARRPFGLVRLRSGGDDCSDRGTWCHRVPLDEFTAGMADGTKVPIRQGVGVVAPLWGRNKPGKGLWSPHRGAFGPTARPLDEVQLTEMVLAVQTKGERDD
jgi:hypothetical protein